MLRRRRGRARDGVGVRAGAQRQALARAHTHSRAACESHAWFRDRGCPGRPCPPRVLLTHVPLFRRSHGAAKAQTRRGGLPAGGPGPRPDDDDTAPAEASRRATVRTVSECGPRRGPRPLVEGGDDYYRSLIPEDVSVALLEALRPELIISGDDHDICEHVHDTGAVEVTFGTASWCVCVCVWGGGGVRESDDPGAQASGGALAVGGDACARRGARGRGRVQAAPRVRGRASAWATRDVPPRAPQIPTPRPLRALRRRVPVLARRAPVGATAHRPTPRRVARVAAATCPQRGRTQRCGGTRHVRCDTASAARGALKCTRQPGLVLSLACTRETRTVMPCFMFTQVHTHGPARPPSTQLPAARLRAEGI